MAIICRTKVNLTGWDGAPGLNIIHWRTPITPGVPSTTHVDDMHDEISAYYDVLSSCLRPGVHWAIDPVVAYLEDSTGEIQGIVTQTGDVHEYDSTATSGNQSPAVQILCRLNTADYVNGRNVKGRMFLGPITDSVVTEDGDLRSDVIESLDDALIAPTSGLGATFVVWHRPTNEAADNGSYHDVSSAVHQAKLAVLRKRRD